MATASLGGIPLPASAAISWKATLGVQPSISEIQITPDALDPLLEMERNRVTLEINGQKWEQLSVLYEVPSGDPNIKAVAVSDRRFWWAYKRHYQFFNRRRRVGFKRRGKWAEELLTDVAAQFEYATFSTKNGQGRGWSSVDILSHLIKSIDGVTPVIQDRGQLLAVPVENLDIDNQGGDAIARLLQSVPGAALTLAPNGRVIVFNWLSGDERSIVGEGLIEVHGEAGPEIVGGGHIEMIDYSKIRPKYVDVEFTPEIEVRFDFLGETTEVENDPAGGIKRTPRRVENVIPNPDFQTTNVTNPTTGNAETLYQGAYGTFQQFISAWTNPPGILSSLDEGIIRRAFVPGRKLWAQLEVASRNDTTANEALWSSRIAAIQRHYRQTWRLPRDWVDRYLEIKPYMVATIDVTSGQRAPAMVFSDHYIKPSAKGIFLGAKSRRVDELRWGWNITGYPGENVALRDTDRPTPARINIDDPDQGVLHVNYNLDPYGKEDVVLPSKVTNIPTRDASRNGGKTPLFFNAISANGLVPQLAADHRMAIIITSPRRLRDHGGFDRPNGP